MAQMVRRAPQVEMSNARAGLHIQAGHWYAWQMLPGYGDSVPYFSPIFVHSVVLSPTNPNILDVHFLNLLYAAGVQDFHMTLRPLLAPTPMSSRSSWKAKRTARSGQGSSPRSPSTGWNSSVRKCSKTFRRERRRRALISQSPRT